MVHANMLEASFEVESLDVVPVYGSDVLKGRSQRLEHQLRIKVSWV